MKVLLRDVTVIDVEARRTLPNRSVLIENDRISAIADVHMGLRNLDDVQVLECSGRFLLPGLADVHVHLQPPVGADSGAEPDHEQADDSHSAVVNTALPLLHSYLYCGVTSIFDAGNDGAFIWPLRDAERHGEMVSPRIFCAGPLVTCSGGHGSNAFETVIVDGLPEHLPALEAHFKHQPDLVKVTYEDNGFANFPLTPILPFRVLRNIVDIAHSHNLRVTVHVSNELRTREAIACDVDTLAHPVFQSPITDELAETLADRASPIASTLAFADRYLRLAEDTSYLDDELFASCIDATERERLRTSEHDTQRESRWTKWLRVMTPVVQENLRRLIDAGGVVATGTDLALGPELLRELHLLQAAGIEPWDVLASATANAARFLGREAELGSVAIGKLADLILVNQDPTTDVSRLAGISMVMIGGRVVDRAKLHLAGERPTQAPTITSHSVTASRPDVIR